MSNATDLWTWEKGAPPGPQVAQAGTRWSFRLPLQGSGPAPNCVWSNLPGGVAAQQPTSDTLMLIVDIPADLSGVHRLSYRIGDNALAGMLLLKILPADASAPQALVTPTPASPAAAPVVTPTPEPAVQTSSFQAASSAPTSAPTGDYEVRVYRGGTLIANKTQPLLRHKSLLVGKFSASKSILPDIDLSGQFPDMPSEGQCSRRQAKVYWSAGRVVLQNEGKSPLDLPDGRKLPPAATHDWQPGEDVGLPGGLTLRLEAKRI